MSDLDIGQKRPPSTPLMQREELGGDEADVFCTDEKLEEGLLLQSVVVCDVV